MTGERGQALVLAVLALALAAITIVGLREAQDRILADARERRAGEAAVDFVASLRDELGGRRTVPSLAELTAFVADPLVLERSRAAAAELAAANGGAAVSALEITAGQRSLDLALTVGAHRQRAAIGTACCRR